jgi:hypothetical protein
MCYICLTDEQRYFYLVDVGKNLQHLLVVFMFFIFGVVTVWADIFTDLSVAKDFYAKGDIYWAGCTLGLTFAPFAANCLEFLIWKCKHFQRIETHPNERRFFREVLWTLPPLHMLK